MERDIDTAQSSVATGQVIQFRLHLQAFDLPEGTPESQHQGNDSAAAAKIENPPRVRAKDVQSCLLQRDGGMGNRLRLLMLPNPGPSRPQFHQRGRTQTESSSMRSRQSLARLAMSSGTRTSNCSSSSASSTSLRVILRILLQRARRFSGTSSLLG